MANERRNRSSSSTTLTRNNLQTTTPANLSQFSFKNGTRATSLKTSETDLTHVDPDSLFVKHTISEIKAIQAKLKADADAKQEELRLMVGERYRDLLQASTSITLMAGSSRRVVDALHRMRKTTSSVQENKPPRIAAQGQEDSYLKILQSLSAHLKLLLDAPESLWRLLEKKEYLDATWLFLLSGVVHRSLTNENSAEVPWGNADINVQTQFPLVQKQWELISQFRLQIAYRATQFLKEGTISSNTACTTLLALHLLNSSPLTETLSTLLSQRNRMLDSLLNDQRLANPEEKPKDPSKRKVLVNDLQKLVLDVVDTICGTMHIARDVFQTKKESTCSMIEQSLENFQTNDPSKALVTTSSLLSTLPSSTYLLTLPRTILTYKPYIDLASPTARVDPSVLDSKLSAWFEKALGPFNGRIQGWFGELISIDEVWSTRKKILDRMQMTYELKESDKASLQDVVDSGVRTRVIQLIDLALKTLENIMRNGLKEILEAIKKNNKLDANPSSFLFSPPELPGVTQIDNIPSMTPFSRYKASIRQRIDGRTPLLEDIQQDIESQASQIRADLDIMQGPAYQTETLQQQVMESYKDSLLSFSSRLSENLETLVKNELVDGDFYEYNLDTFVGRLCYHLSRSQFLLKLQYNLLSDQGLLHTLDRLQDQCISSWRERTVLKAVNEYKDMFVTTYHVDQLDSPLPTRPSGCLVNALMILNSSLNDLGLPRHRIATKGISRKLLASFGSAIADNIPFESLTWHRKLQITWDITFLLKLQPESIEENSLLMKKSVALRTKLVSVLSSDVISDLDRSTSAYLLRSQTLFGPLIDLPAVAQAQNGVPSKKGEISLKSKPTSLLRLGTPDVEQDYFPAIELAKPSSRFTMLLVSSTESS